MGAACGNGLGRIRTNYNGLVSAIEELGDIEAWRPEASVPGCSVG